MSLSNDLVSQFVQVTNKQEFKKDTAIYGTVVIKEHIEYVKIDGSDALTPIITTSTLHQDDRVIVDIKNHTAVVIGNVTHPSGSQSDIDDIIKENAGTVEKVENLVADNVVVKKSIATLTLNVSGKLSAKDADLKYATIENLKVTDAKVAGKLSATEADLKYATIDNLKVTDAKVEGKLSAKDADLKYATIENLKVTDANVSGKLSAKDADLKYATIDNLKVTNADVASLKTDKLSVTEAKLKYAQIDFANIGSAAVEKIFADSGIIKDLVMSDSHVTGELVGVTIKGDLIEAGTVKADKLLIKGNNGLYYRLNTDGESVEAKQTNENSINGSVITAHTITASKVNVDDLLAFDATIGGFKIDNNSIHTIAKPAPTLNVNGVYMDNSGQFGIGDSANHIQYYKNKNSDDYTLDVVASTLHVGSKTISEIATDATTKSFSDVNDRINDATTTANNANNTADDALSKAKQTGNDLADLKNQVDISITKDYIKTTVDSAVKTGTAAGVKTTTGVTVNADGITVDKTGSPTTTNISDNGMKVYRNQAGVQKPVEMLTANDAGVNARNLHATTYLIVGNCIRFEKYTDSAGNKAAACFWIGG